MIGSLSEQKLEYASVMQCHRKSWAVRGFGQGVERQKGQTRSGMLGGADTTFIVKQAQGAATAKPLRTFPQQKQFAGLDDLVAIHHSLPRILRRTVNGRASSG